MAGTIEQKVQQLLVEHRGERIISFDFSGRKYWLKQPEQLHGRMRLLKAHPESSLELEKSCLQQLAEQHAPVPHIVYEQQGCMVLEDVGPTLKQWIARKDVSPAFQRQVLLDSAEALAQLHNLGLAHGRPALRDISWQQGQVKFIDFEARAPRKGMLYQHIRDLLVYIHSLYRYLGPNNQLIADVVLQYRRSGGEIIWQACKSFLASWQWLYYLMKPFRHRGGRDVKPIFWLLWHFRHA
ncbi:serine/threonine protein phosphatase [Shewanella mangrovi]|uniref:Serine/threonine protein phosphatase n=1 Tax=Shewanella mangrovi TaxID=1515746 RepID=A0A094JLA7_9GAMM|nr:lipopolysaccharide kinase InaA family protein [Shewanella mangrovi]KFZ38829.1 serine/threonine protein phosphatase [Shewanella mangrovi]